MRSLVKEGHRLPTGLGVLRPGRKRKMPEGEGQHDCFQAVDFFTFAEEPQTLGEADLLHLLGGLACGCVTCWKAIEDAQGEIEANEETSLEVAFLLVLTVYPPHTLPLSLRQALEEARAGGVAHLLALWVESVALFAWDQPERLLEALNRARVWMGSPAEKDVAARIETYSARAWLRTDYPDRALKAETGLGMAYLYAEHSERPELLATTMAARAEMEPGASGIHLAMAISKLPPGHPMRAELLMERAAYEVREGLPVDALVFLLEALAELEVVAEDHPELSIRLLHVTACLAARFIDHDNPKPPMFGLYGTLAWTANRLCQECIENYPDAGEDLCDESPALARIVSAVEAFRERSAIVAGWETVTTGAEALELLWLAQAFGHGTFVDLRREQVQERYETFCPAALLGNLHSYHQASRGSEIGRLVLNPFRNLLATLSNR